MIRPVGARTTATIAVSAVVKEQRSLSDILPELISGAEQGEAGLIHELTSGSLRWWWQLSAIVDELLQKPFKSRDFDLYCLLIIGLYQIIHTRIPDHAAVSETVNCTKSMNKSWSKNLVNAVLRRYLRDHAKLNKKLSVSNSFLYSHPLWMIDNVQKDWPHDWEALLEANNSAPSITIRANCQKTTQTGLRELLAERGIEATATHDSPSGLVINSRRRVWETDLWEQGLFSVQDESAQLAGILTDLKPGMRVLDACAAPGGKTCHLLEREPGLQLLALDNNSVRLARVGENLDRLGLSCETKVADASCPDSWWDGKTYDLVIIDAPCSGSGVIKKHPDIKHLRRQSDIAQSVSLQQLLLYKLWPLLRQGGKLLYFTCSVFRQENDAQANGFLDQHSDAAPVCLAECYGLDTGCGRQRLPGHCNSDGFYYACFEKISV